MESDDGLPLPVLKPPIARDFSVVIIRLSVATFPVMKFIGCQSEPAKQLLGRQFGSFGPVIDVINNLVSRVMRNPATG